MREMAGAEICNCNIWCFLSSSFHHSERMNEMCRKAGVKLLYLPHYSPEFNPIEEFIEEFFAELNFLSRTSPAS